MELSKTKREKWCNMKYVTSAIVGFSILGAAVLATGNAGAFGNPSGTIVVAPTTVVPDCVSNGNSFQCIINYYAWIFSGNGSSGGAVEAYTNTSNHTFWDGVDIQCNGVDQPYMPWRGPYNNNNTSNPAGLNWWYCPALTSPTEIFGAFCDTTLTNNCNINIPF